MNPTIRLHQLQGTPEPPRNPGRFTQVPTRFDARRKRVDSDTGEVTYSRHDPDAIAHHHHLWAEDPESGDVRCKICDSNRRQATTGSGSDGPQIYEAVTLLTRADERQGRLILGIGLRHAHQTDANLFTDMVLDLKHNNPSLSDAALMCVYDQRLNATDFDRLHDDGNIPIRKVGHDPGGRKKVRVLHDQPFELADGTKAAHDVHVANGTPSLRVHDADGVEWLIETVRTKMQRNRLKNSRVIYCEWQVADHALAGDLAGATARIRHNSKKREIETGRRRSVYLRVCPESSPEHPEVFGLREDAESHNSTQKRQLIDGRVRSVGRTRNALNLLAFQMTWNDTAMYAHYMRHANIDAYATRFAYKPPRRADPLLAAA